MPPATVVIPPGVSGTAITCGPAVAGFITGKIVKAATPPETPKGWRVLGGAGAGALTGAAIGSVVPGIGTGIGMGIGAVCGAIGAFFS